MSRLKLLRASSICILLIFYALIILFSLTPSVAKLKKLDINNGILNVSSWVDHTKFIDLNGQWLNEQEKLYTVKAKSEKYATKLYTLKVTNDEAHTIRGLYIGDITSYVDIWIDDKRVASKDNVAHSSFVTFTTPNTNYTIRLQVSSDYSSRIGINGPVYFGEAKQIENYHQLEHALNFFMIGFLLAIALYSTQQLFLREQKRNLIGIAFALFCWVMMLRISVTGAVVLNLIVPLSQYAKIHLEYISLIIAGILFCMYVYYTFDVKYSKLRFLYYSVTICSFIYLIIIIFTSPYFFSSLLSYYLIVLMLIVLFNILIFIRALILKQRGSFINALGVFMFLYFVTGDLFFVYANIANSPILAKIATFFVIPSFPTLWGLLLLVLTQTLLYVERWFITNENIWSLQEQQLRLNGELIIKNERINEAYEAIEQNNAQLERTILERTSEIRLLFANIEQAIFMFDTQMYIAPNYSESCENLFGEQFSEFKYIDVLKQTTLGQDDLDDIIKICPFIFQTDSTIQREAFMTLLPTQLRTKTHSLTVSYKWLTTAQKIMVIVTNITEKEQLVLQHEREHLEMKMALKVIEMKTLFSTVIEQYMQFVKQSPTDTLTLFSQQLHTFKGTFSQFFMQNTVAHIHDFETLLHECTDEITQRQCIDEKNLVTFIADDLDILKKRLGAHFFERVHKIEIAQTQYEQLKQTILNEVQLPENVQQTLIRMLTNWQRTPLHEMLMIYDEHVEQLALKCEKYVQPIIWDYDAILVDQKLYLPFVQQLGHIFRNIVDHGIETAEVRDVFGKNYAGTITCTIKQQLEHIVITICDDGSGIDVEKLQLTFMKNFPTINTTTWTTKQWLHTIFTDGVTTKKEATLVSGRGVGMSALYEVITQMQGTIDVESEHYVGTTFTIMLPLN